MALVGTVMALALAASWRGGDAAGARAGRTAAAQAHRRAAVAGGFGQPGGARAGASGGAGGAAGAAVTITGAGAGGEAWAKRLNGALSGRLGDGAGWATVNGEAESLAAPPAGTLLRVRWSIAGRGGMADCGTATVSAMDEAAIMGEMGDVFGAATRRSGTMGQAVCG